MSIWLDRIKSFLDTHKEWHSFVDGFCIVAFPFLLAVREIRKELGKAIRGELHYFLFGAFLGVLFITLMLYLLIG